MTVAPWMPTFSGGRFLFDVWLPSNVITIGDIAHPLSFQCRYNGHTKSFYSVAEHSVRVALLVMELVPEENDKAEWGLAALMHDAAEAFVGDIISPIKARYFDNSIEHNIDDLIGKTFGVSVDIMHSSFVKKADLILLATEMRDFFGQDVVDKLALTEQPLEGIIEPWQPADAEARFLSLYYQLTDRLPSSTKTSQP